MPAARRILNLEPIDQGAEVFAFETGPLHGPVASQGASIAGFGSFEALEQLATFASRAHALICCPCGEDHSGELLAFKTSLTAVVGNVGIQLISDTAQAAADGTPEAATVVIPGDVTGNNSSATVLSIGNSMVSQVEVSGDQDWYKVTLVAGVTYQFELNGTGGDALSDPYLELMNASGSQLKFDDDGGTGLNSLLRYTPTTSGTYFVNAHGWIDAGGNTSTGTYTLTATQAATLPTYSTAQIANYLVNEGTSGGRSWQQTNITYNIEALTSAQQVLAIRALADWSAVTPLTFTRTTGNGNITFQNTDPDADPADPNAQAAFAQNTYSGAGFITASTVVITSNWFGSDTTFDSYTQQTYIHEVGHALGLGHAGPYNGAADFGTDNIYTNDNWASTVMSYFDQNEAGFGSYRFVLGLQQADVDAIQLLYGSNPAGTHAGNTTFGFNSSAAGTNIDWSQFVVVNSVGTYRRPPSMTLYDTGGVDTINLSGFSQPQILNLNPGTSSSLGDRTPTLDAPSINYVNVISIHASTTIENAIGGSGDDTLSGNSAGNTINGLLGNDTILGLGGNDLLNGGDALQLSSAAAQIYRLYLGTLDREPDVPGHQGWIAFMAANNHSITEIASGFVNSSEFQLQYGSYDNGQFVTLLYNNVLGRAPDQAGYDGWVSRLDNGTTRAAVVVGFTESLEYIQLTDYASQGYATTQFNGNVESQIFRLYAATLDRSPDAAGFLGWVNFIHSGQRTLADIIPGFVESSEFQQLYGPLNNTQFVTLLYNNVLGRAPDPLGLEGWVSRLDAGQSRSSIVSGFSESIEFIQNTNSAFISFMRSTDLGWQDSLSAGNGTDSLLGGRGSDTFIVTASETGTKTVYGLQPYDYVRLQGFASLAQFTSSLTQQGSDAVFTSVGQSVRFANTAVSTVISVLQLGVSAEVADTGSNAQSAEGASGIDAAVAVPASAETAPDPVGTALAGLSADLGLAANLITDQVQAGFTLAVLSGADTFDFAALAGLPEEPSVQVQLADIQVALVQVLETGSPSQLIDAAPDVFDFNFDLDRPEQPLYADWA